MIPKRFDIEKDRHQTRIGLGLDGTLLIAVTISTMYIILIFRRSAILNEYSLPANVRAYGFSNDEREISYTSYRSPTKKGLSVEVDSQESQQSKNYYNHQRDTQFMPILLAGAASPPK